MTSKILLLSLLLTGCSYLPLRPGHAYTDTASGFHSSLKQSQNPQAPTTQKYEHTTTLPTGTVTTEKNEISIGAAQKDLGREVSAKLASLRWITWLGALVFLFGVASAFYPPLKLIVGSVTTSAACAAAGAALIILPVVIVGHELLIVAIALGAAGIWWLSHHHAAVATELAVIKKDIKNVL